MIRSLITILSAAWFLMPAAVPGASGAENQAGPDSAGARLPAGVLHFHGKVTGTVTAVDAANSEVKVKVTNASADPEKNKATKPETLTGMTITITPLMTTKDGKPVLDEAAVAYIKGSRAGDPVTLNVRASGKGMVFRLLKVPVSGGK